MTVHIKRVYEASSAKDGLRVLVDRVWPRGLSRDAAHIELWMKDIAPSAPLRKWFDHEPQKWEEFKRRYFHELDGREETVSELEKFSRNGPVTLVYSAAERRFNNAVALEEYLKQRRS